MALVCASRGCPTLAARPWQGPWLANDFARDAGSVEERLTRHSPAIGRALAGGALLAIIPWDWSLNERPARR